MGQDANHLVVSPLPARLFPLSKIAKISKLVSIVRGIQMEYVRIKPAETSPIFWLAVLTTTLDHLRNYLAPAKLISLAPIVRT
jgi:hypothetical protein